MVNVQELIEKDVHHVWHPCAQMKDFETTPPLVIEGAKGSCLYTNQGVLIDGISSWWCKSLGHGHPNIISAIHNQLDAFEHVIAANTTHPTLVELAQELTQLTKKQHVFFASDGSSAVEIAMKLAIHANQIKGLTHKNEFIALKNGYHGETLGTMSISDLGLYKAPYSSFGVHCYFIEPPYVTGRKDPLWGDCTEHWNATLKYLATIKDTVCAVVLEPLIQGAGGMLCYSADFLNRLARWAKENQIYFIVDEIMTGVGRTGTWLASEHALIEGDLICLSKGLTSGSIPFSCVMIDHDIFNLFYSDYQTGPSFLHSHTYSGNPLAISAALATIRTMQEEHTLANAAHLEELMMSHFNDIAAKTGRLQNIRGLGAVVAADLIADDKVRVGNQIYKHALKYGALLRPIGNVLYWLPPLNSDEQTIELLAKITAQSINATYA